MRHLVVDRSSLFLRRPAGRVRARTGLVIAAVSATAILATPLLSALAAGSTFQFAPKADYATGEKPQGVATADLNGDGKTDVVSANTEANTVSVLLGNGDGTFKTKVDYATGTAPTGVAIADLNGDNKPDLIVTNSGSNTVSVLLGKGDGTFEAQTEYATGTAPAAVAVADLNGDKKPDLIVANRGSNSVSVLLGKGDGTFEAQTEYATGTAPAAVAVADLNGDKKPDVIAANSGSNSVSVLLGKGDGTFEAGTEYTTGAKPQALAAGDLNGDGKTDVVTANTEANTVSVLLGNGDGTLKTKVDYATGTAPSGVAIGDFNADKKPDLVTANAVASTASLLLGKGDGTFEKKLDFTTGTKPQAVATADLNGDGKLDLVTANTEANTVSVLLNTSVPSLEASAIEAFPGTLYGTSSSAQKVKVTNGGSATLSISSVEAAGNFSASGCAGSSLAPKASCEIKVTFKPKGYGTLKGTLTIASNAPGSPKVINLSGTGLPPAAIVKTGAVSEIIGSYATLNGSVVSQGPGSFYFEYGTTLAYGSQTPTLPLSSSASPQQLAATLSLMPGTTYHYRLVASNLAGTVHGDDQVFTIPPEEPTLALARRHLRLGWVLKHGLPLRVSETSPSLVTVKLSIDARTAHSAHLAARNRLRKHAVTIGSARVHLDGSSAKTITVKISATAAERLAHLKRLKLTIQGTASTPTGVTGSPSEITVKLRR
jgi:hypothetical protein